MLHDQQPTCYVIMYMLCIVWGTQQLIGVHKLVLPIIIILLLLFTHHFHAQRNLLVFPTFPIFTLTRSAHPLTGAQTNWSELLGGVHSVQPARFVLVLGYYAIFVYMQQRNRLLGLSFLQRTLGHRFGFVGCTDIWWTPDVAQGSGREWMPSSLGEAIKEQRTQRKH